MGEVLDFPIKEKNEKSLTEIEIKNDPYYQFIRNVLTTADSCGFGLPFTVESAAEHVYHRTRKTSQLARMLEVEKD